MGEALDTNKELITVGISNGKFIILNVLRSNLYNCTSFIIFVPKIAVNGKILLAVVSGLLCGFTGSYIFSQTIFVYRTKCNTRWIGIITAVGELAVFLCTVNVLEVTPLFFLGATLIFIGFDLMYEWVSK